MFNKTPAALFTLLIFLFAPAFVGADVVSDMAMQSANAVFSEAERQVIEKYYKVTKPVHDKEQKPDDEGEYEDDEDNDNKEKGKKKKDKGKGKDKNKGKGKHKQKAMPKGIVKKLERGGAMPPGIAKTRLPLDLEQQLPPAPAGFERIESNGEVVLAEIATGVIADIIKIGTRSGSIRSGEKSMEKTNIHQESQVDKKPQVQQKTAVPHQAEKKWWEIWKD